MDIKRPLSVSIIGYLYAITSPLSLFFSLASLRSPEMLQAVEGYYRVDTTWVMGFSAITCLLTFVFGIGILKGKTWARQGFATLTIANVLITFAVSKSLFSTAIGVALSLVAVYFLYRKPAREFFAARAQANAAGSN